LRSRRSGAPIGRGIVLMTTFSLLAMTSAPLVAVTAGVVGIGVGVIVAVAIQRIVMGRTIGTARAEAARLVEQAENEARTNAERIEVDAEKRLLDRKTTFDSEVEEIRKELREGERRLGKREDLVDRKEDALTIKEQNLTRMSEKLGERDQRLTAREQLVEEALEQQTQRLIEIADMSRDEARQRLLERVESETRMDMARIVRKVTEEAESEAREKSREITLMAIQRYAADVTSESTVRSVPIPSDDMKGRIIGREGRNIRAIERATGVDIIVDDTPGVIVVSCFDKVRQAVAVEALNRLIADGRMHPARIEEVVEKVRSETDERIVNYGKEAALEANLRGMHPKIVEAMGKLHYRTSLSQNVLRHSIEVAYMSQIIADMLGLDGTVARRCGFLHDIGKAMDHEMEGGHPKIGMDFAKQYGEKEPVLNVIGGHHGDIPATSFYTPIVMAADAVSSARPGARRESMERYVQRLNELQDIAMSHDGVTEAYAIQAGREVRVMVDAKKVSDDAAHLIASNIAKRVSSEMTFPGEIRVTVLRETRAIEYAR
jgi:ribonuclease Y